MGRGKQWTPEESLHLAEAWLEISEDVGAAEVKGTNQDSHVFWARIEESFKAKAPTPNPEGQYNDRATSDIITQWKDKISRQAKKFNKALMKVFRSHPTGCTEQNKINMAVAIHLRKTDKMDYTHRDYIASNWQFYPAWCVLKEHRAFLPPQVPNEDNTVELTEDEDVTPVVLEEDGLVTPVQKKGTSRGPGAGARKTKALAREEEYRNKKAKVQEGLLEVQRKRMECFDTYVTNQARTSAFKMTMMAYDCFKDHDPAEAAKYKQKMQDIMEGNTDGDGHGTMPELGGSVGNNVGI